MGEFVEFFWGKGEGIGDILQGAKPGGGMGDEAVGM